MYTRDDYLRGCCTHREYYGQFVQESTKELVIRFFGEQTLKDAWVMDPSFNTDITPLGSWDFLARQLGNRVKALLKDAGDYMTLAGGVCILKEAARQVVNG